MKKITLNKDQVKIIEYALELAYECCDGSPVLKYVDYNHPNFEKNLVHDFNVANQIRDKLRESNE
jgi:hypothetical protein